MKLRQLGEDSLLEKLVRTFPAHKRVVIGAGDDAAVVTTRDKSTLLVLKTDCVVEHVHFHEKTSPAAIGWKAMMRPLSDFAAMSGIPEFALITLVVPAEKETAWVQKIYRGLGRAAARFNVTIVGGETSRTPGPTVISVAVSGFVEKDRWVSRSGAKPGDGIFVTGRLGGSLRGKHLRFVPRIEESRWLTAHFSPHAMMDLSDGLGTDLPRLARASKVGFQIEEEKLPVNAGTKIENAISDGEDYELFFAISPRETTRLETSWRKKFKKLPLTRIGRFVRASDTKHQSLGRGYVHFK